MNGIVIANEVKLYYRVAMSLRICNDFFIWPFAIELMIARSVCRVLGLGPGHLVSSPKTIC